MSFRLQQSSASMRPNQLVKRSSPNSARSLCETRCHFCFRSTATANSVIFPRTLSLHFSTRNPIDASDTEIRHRSCQKEQSTPVRRLKPTTWRTYPPLNAQITPCQKPAPHSDISFFASLWCFNPLSRGLPVSSVKGNLQRQRDTLQDESGIIPYTERTDELGGFWPPRRTFANSMM